MSNAPRAVRVAALASAIAACGLTAIATSPPAPGITGDSFLYLGGADLLRARGKLQYPDWSWATADSVQPMTRVTPGLALALAGLMSLGASPRASARLIQSLSAGVTVGFSALLIGAASTPLIGVLAGLSLFALPVFQWVHLYVLTEPLFLAAVVFGLWALLSRNGSALAGIALLVATMTRYVGVSLAMAVGLAALFLGGRWTVRAARVAAVAGPSLLFFFVWRWWTTTAPGAKPIEARGPFPLNDEPSQAIRSIATWLAPGSRPILQFVIVAAMCACALAVLSRRGGRVLRRRETTASTERATQRDWAHPRIATLTIILMVICYAIFVVLSRVFGEPTIQFAERMFLPVYVLAQLLAGLILPDLIRGNRWALTFAVIGLAVWLTVSVRVALATVIGERRRGLGIASEEFRASPTLRWLAASARGRALFTNHPLAVYYHAGRHAKLWPRHVLPDSARALVGRLRASDGLIVDFRHPDLGVPVASLEEISSRVPLRRLATFEDGAVYELDLRTTIDDARR